MLFDDEYTNTDQSSTDDTENTEPAYVYVDDAKADDVRYSSPTEGPTYTEASQHKQRSLVPAIIITALITLTVCSCIGYLITRDIAFANNRATPFVAQTPAETDDEVQPESTASAGLVIGNSQSNTSASDSSDLIQECMRTVVSINIEVVTSTYYGDTISKGAGSGVILTADGYIATCNHVIEDASSISVSLQDGTTYEAKVIGYDSRTDLAIIKIDATELPAAVIGSSNTYSVGDKVYAIGNPLGEYASTVTNGIISGIDRSVEIDGVSMTLMQTDAAINPGNSGGGLFSAETGELLGIVNAKNYGTEIEGLGFAIPTSAAHEIIVDLMDKGFVSGRPYLGITPETVRFSNGGGFFGFGTVTSYVRIKAVRENSPAEAAGLQTGDYILAIGDTEISTSEDISKVLNNHNAGDKIELHIQRDNQNMIVSVTLGESSGK